MKNYELTSILRADLSSEQLTQAQESVISFIQSKGGILLNQDIKGKKPLPARVKDQKEGVVSVLKFTMDASHMQDLEKYLREHAQILRFLCLISISRKVKNRTPHLVPSLGGTPQVAQGQSFNLEPQDRKEATETKTMDLGEIDKKLEEIFKQP